MNAKQLNLRSTFLLLVVFGTLLTAGCASSDPHGENVSERPWNDTQGWQGGLPSGLNEGR